MWPNLPPNTPPFKWVICETDTGYYRISWDLEGPFSDPTPWTFQVQINNLNGQDDAWENIGDPVQDANFVRIEQGRHYIPNVTPLFRVILTTPQGAYTSGAVSSLGELTWRQRYIAKKLYRLLRLERPSMPRLRGWLLHRKAVGSPCTCSSQIKAATDSKCRICYGTGVIGGFWKPADSPVILISAQQSAARIDMKLGTTVNVAKQGLFVGLPLVYPRDVWVDSVSRLRYIIREANIAAELNGIPLIIQATMGLIPPDSPIYAIEVN